MQFNWTNLPKPFFCLAPMEDVTDCVFRQIIIETGRPHVLFSEFTSIDGIWSDGNSNVTKRLKFENKEKPLIAQVWGNNPELFYKTAKYIKEIGFDGIDINLGCPVKNIIKQNCGSKLISQHKLVKEIIQSVKEASPDFPFSIKTRLGFEKIDTENWIGFLVEQNLDAITVHGRDAKHSNLPANWDEIKKAVQIKNQILLNNPSYKKTLIIGNGDISSYQDGIDKYQFSKVDGLMVGRGIFTNPWLFNANIDFKKITISERLNLLTKHLILFQNIWQGNKPYKVLKKYFKIYLNGFENASFVRDKLMKTRNIKEAQKVINEYNTLK